MQKVHVKKRKLRESGADGADNYVCCFECVFGEKLISGRLWPLVSLANPMSLLLSRCVQEEKNGSNHKGECVKKKAFQNIMSSTSPAAFELEENMCF